MKKFILLAALFSSSAFASNLVSLSVGDIAVAQVEEDGTYTVICKNGNRENVTDLDIKIGNVCPNLTESEPTEILSLQFRDDGAFDVVCRDMTKKVATAEEIMAGGVCAPIVPPLLIEDGSYTVQSGYMSWCPQRVQANYDNDGVLTSMDVSYLSPCGSSESYTCSGKVCTTSRYMLTILTPTSYEFANDDGSEAGVFQKDN